MKSPRYCELPESCFHLSQPILGHGICHALHNDEKLRKEAARITCDIIYWITYFFLQKYFFLQEILLWIKAFSSIFGRSEAARLCTVSSIGRYHFV